MSSDFSLAFRRRFSKAFEASDFKSQRSLSLAAGWSESRINRILTGQFDSSKDGPGFFGLVRVCEQLGVTPDFLAGIQKWTSSSPATTLNATSFLHSLSTEHSPPSIKTLIRLYVRSGQRIEAFKPYLDYCDVYETPNTDLQSVRILSVGEKSLSALRMGENNPVILQEAYDNAPIAFRKRIFDSHLRAYNSGMTVEPDAIDERMSNRPVHVKIDYIRVAMKLEDAKGRERVLIYCELLPQ